MAKNLTDKLNTLIRSSMHGAFGDGTPRSRRRDQPLKLGKDIDREVAALRQQIDKALGDEDRLTAEINALQRQVADWDQQADRALAKGDEAAARHAVRQMQLEQRRLTMLEADLAQHRFSTSELISRVNELEALVAEARQRQKEVAEPENPAEESLSARLRRARQEAASTQTAAQPDAPVVVDEKVIEDDLARRRARLSQ
jgi:chromosome segregation ATPase